ncbi:unnamed protein product [Moneuplotes crassus]|uniref:Uncharacterized protein n=1 Tax=Euplotes crassus TaxID=5936 RepID=A0AAD1US87_EUPCR|nr:unnamed protein product [Moneuplotes crassus]
MENKSTKVNYLISKVSAQNNSKTIKSLSRQGGVSQNSSRRNNPSRYIMSKQRNADISIVFTPKRNKKPKIRLGKKPRPKTRVLEQHFRTKAFEKLKNPSCNVSNEKQEFGNIKEEHNLSILKITQSQVKYNSLIEGSSPFESSSTIMFETEPRTGIKSKNNSQCRRENKTFISFTKPLLSRQSKRHTEIQEAQFRNFERNKSAIKSPSRRSNKMTVLSPNGDHRNLEKHRLRSCDALNDKCSLISFTKSPKSNNQRVFQLTNYHKISKNCKMMMVTKERIWNLKERLKLRDRNLNPVKLFQKLKTRGHNPPKKSLRISNF